MTDELERGETLLLVLMEGMSGSVSPKALFDSAASVEGRPSAKNLRIALWSLEQQGKIERLDDNTLRRVYG